MLFERKVLDEQFVTREAWPLFERHYREVSAFQDIPLQPDFESYLAMEKAGMVRCYVARITTADNTLALIGYAIYFVRKNLHYRTSKQAVQDVIYLEKSTRGLGMGKAFIDWCDEQLKAEGVQVVYHHVKDKLNFGPLLEGLGYKRIEAVWGRRLDQ